MKKTIIYLSIIIISVGLSLGFTHFIDKSNEVGDGEELGATITTILSTDQISDSRTVINDNFAALNNAIHWSAGSDYLSASSSPTFGIILGDTSSSTIGALKIIGDLSVTGNVTSTNATSSWLYISNSLTIGAYVIPNTDGNANDVLKTDGSGNVTWQADEDSGILKGAAWEYIWSGALTPTTTNAGIFVTASSTIHNNFRIAGNATTTGSFYIGNDLRVISDLRVDGVFRANSYYVTSTPSTHTGTTESVITTATIKGGDMYLNGMFRAKVKGSGSVSNNKCWLIAKYGGTTIATSTFIETMSEDWFAEIEVHNRNNVASQHTTFELLLPGIHADSESSQASSTAMTKDSTSDQTFTVSGDCLHGSDTLTIEVMDIQLYRD